MYSLLPDGTRFPAEVQWRYEKSAADWAGIAVSAATLIAILAWPVWGGPVRKWLGGWWLRRRKAWDSDDG